ncbi:hypothetical protein LPJ64_006252 [Coemansia asiatica]|uniref:Uncharacterized protein n=1 Tax=Coemansia asiatica TaxID=1052880 RepID=A0A9W7XG40_9FUNG|nr:hypothetical protein LPJ64_006252 [Coemansia asiatica]
MTASTTSSAALVATSLSVKESMLDFNYSVKDIEQTVEQFIAEANKVYDQVASVKFFIDIYAREDLFKLKWTSSAMRTKD